MEVARWGASVVESVGRVAVLLEGAERVAGRVVVPVVGKVVVCWVDDEVEMKEVGARVADMMEVTRAAEAEVMEVASTEERPVEAGSQAGEVVAK